MRATENGKASQASEASEASEVSQEPLSIRRAVQALSDRMLHYTADPEGIALALPNRSLAMAFSISKLLQIPMDVFVVRTLRAPCNCPCIIGALTESDVVYLDQNVVARQEWLHRELRAHIEKEIQTHRAEIVRQATYLRVGRQLSNLARRDVLFIDDGSAPLATMFASIETFRRLHARRIVVAIPMQTSPVIRSIRQRVDELIVPSPLIASRSGYPEVILRAG